MFRKALICLAILSLLAFGLAEAFCAPLDFRWAPYLRLRHEYWDNISDMNDSTRDSRNFYRFKASLWGRLNVTKNLSAYARLTNESRAYVEHFSGDSARDASYNINEAVVDNLYVDIKNAFGCPVDLRLGRQDFLGAYGEGFLVMDGTPLDGSRTFYFNAAKAAWRIDGKNTIDLLYINNPRYDTFLPVINEVEGRQLLNATDETAWGLYHKTDAMDSLRWENFYFFKTEDGGGPGLTAQKTDLSTVGSFAKYTLGPWSLRGQLAYQFGKYGPEGRTGIGGYGFVDGKWKNIVFSPEASAGFAYLSGDDPSTAKNEAWDPLFSRWPWMSELYVMSYNGESGMGYWTNLRIIRASFAVTPLKNAKLSLWYNILNANEAATGSMFGIGKNRGTLFQGRLDYAFTKNIALYLLAEHFMPGDFYVKPVDSALFVRTELQLKY